jgi:hypothetical protein
MRRTNRRPDTSDAPPHREGHRLPTTDTPGFNFSALVQHAVRFGTPSDPSIVGLSKATAASAEKPRRTKRTCTKKVGTDRGTVPQIPGQLLRTSSPEDAARIGVVKLASEPGKVNHEPLVLVQVELNDPHISAAEPGTIRVISQLLPGPTPDTIIVVESTRELVSTGIYATLKEISVRRITVPAASCRTTKLTDKDLFDLEIEVARVDVARILGPRLTLLNDDDSPTTADQSIRLDLGDGVKRYGVPQDLSVEERDALYALRAIQSTVAFVDDGGSVSGVMRGLALGSALEPLRIRPHEAAVRQVQRTKNALPVARKAKSAKSAEHRQWAQDNFPAQLLAAGGNRVRASQNMAALFKSQFPKAKPVAPRTILVWVANKRPTRAK